MGKLAVSWFEVGLIVVFGAVCVVAAAYLDDREDVFKAEPALEPEDVELRSEVPARQGELATLDQRLTALRAQAIASEIEAGRRRAELAALDARYPELHLRGQRISDPGGLAPVIKAFDDAAVASAVSTALAQELAVEIKALETSRPGKASALRKAQRRAAEDGTRLRRERERTWRYAFLERAGIAGGGLAVVAGLVAFVLAGRNRRLFSGLSVLASVAGISIVALSYHVLPALAAGAGIVFGVIVIAVTARKTR